MSITKKAISVGLSAALLASLAATVVAPAAVLAGTSVTSAGNILLPTSGNTSTSAPASFSFTENAVNSWTGAGSIVVTVLDSGGGHAADITLGGTLVVTAPGYLGASASVSGNTLTITTTGPGSNSLLESITVSGVTITIDHSVATGALQATAVGSGGLANSTFGPTSATATGIVHATTTNGGAAVTSLLVDVTSTCPFISVAANQTATISAISTSSGANNTVTITTSAAHGLVAGETVTLSGTNSTPTINGSYVVQSVPTTTTFTINNAVPVTVAGGTAAVAANGASSGVNNATVITTAAGRGWYVGETVTLSGTGSPNIDGTYTIQAVGSTTTFTIYLAAAVAANAAQTGTAAPAATVTLAASGNDIIVGGVDTGAAGTASVLTAGQQTLASLANLGTAIAAGTAVTETVPNCGGATVTLGSPGTVVGAAYFSSVTPVIVQPSENNQGPTNSIVLNEPSAGFIAAGTTLTFTLAPAGVQFSYSPSVTFAGGFAGSTTACVINAARTACSFTVPTASSGSAGTITFTGFKLDLGAVSNSANVTLTASGVAVYNNGPVIATSALLVVASAATPTVYIGFNDQPSGQITITEGAAGFFSSSPSLNNTIGVCLTATSDTFTRAPWAVVTSGDLKLAAGSPIAPVAQAAGTLFTGTYNATSVSCAYWTVYSASTTASTIQIRGTDASGNVLAAGATNGVNLSIAPTGVPGTVQAQVYAGTNANVTSGTAKVADGLVAIAVRAFKNQPLVAAVSQPVIGAGMARVKLGDLTITETQAGQFKANESITVCLAQLSYPETNPYQAFFRTGVQADLPIVSTNLASGLLATFGGFGQTNTCFTVSVTQQATGTLGVITISNMWVTTYTDAAKGPVLIRAYTPVYSCTQFQLGRLRLATASLCNNPGVAFDQTVSNAIVAAVQPVVMSADSSLSASGPFTTATKILKKGQSITIRVRTNPSLAGTKLGVWIAIKGASSWGAYKPHTSVITDVTGTAYYTYKFTSNAWLAFRLYYGGDATHAAAWSYPSVFGRAM